MRECGDGFDLAHRTDNFATKSEWGGHLAAKLARKSSDGTTLTFESPAGKP